MRNLSSLLTPFKGVKTLWEASFVSPKSTDGLDEFNAIANIAARGCLLIGGITSMGLTYVVSYSIFKELMPTYLAQTCSIIAIVFLFIILDAFLGVTFPLWAKYFTQGKFNRKKYGNSMALAGILLFLISAGVCGISVGLSYNSAEIPVVMSLSSTKKDSTTSDALSKAMSAHLSINQLNESYNDKLAIAKERDEQEIERLKEKGSKIIAAKKRKYAKYRWKNPDKYANRINKAERDSMNLVEGYQRQYDRVYRDMQVAVDRLQNSSSRIETAMLDKEDRMQGLFDKQYNISVGILRILGVAGSLLFMFIKLVQIILNDGVSKVKESEQKRKRVKFQETFSKNETANRTNRDSSGIKAEHNWNKVKETRNSMEFVNTDFGTDTEQDGTDTIDVMGVYKTKSQIRSAISRHANKSTHATTARGKENEVKKCLLHIAALATLDPAEAYKLGQDVKHKYNLDIDI
jgi:hypothetical protein